MASSAALNPFVLVAGTFAAPILLGTVGRMVLPMDKTAKDPEAELRSTILKFSLLNAAAAGLLAYGSSHAKSEKVRSATLGGAIGTSLIAGVLGATVLLTPKAEAAPPPGAPGAALPAKTPSFISNFVGVQ